MTFSEYKQQLLEYLHCEKELAEKDIEIHQSLSDKEKIEQGYLLRGCLVQKQIDDCYELLASENNSKLRSGDRVVMISPNNGVKNYATIVENFFDHITITTDAKLSYDTAYDIIITEAVFLDPLIQLIERVEEGLSGSFYIEELAGIQEPDAAGSRSIDYDTLTFQQSFNEAQSEAIRNALLRPSVYCIQGPPGTGKTDVLSHIAKSFSERGDEVLIVSNTHQAVNNALNKISRFNVPLVKIGETLKAQGLQDTVALAKTYNAYLKMRGKKRRRTNGTVIGMTLHAAIVNLGLRLTGFSPSVILVDEAGQIPLTFGAALGLLGTSSIILIGDDRQMPPIFHPGLAGHPLSVSIFTHISNLYPQLRTVLDTTYRMNKDITAYVSSHFYEPFGITLKSNKIPQYNDSIEIKSLPVVDGVTWEEYNPEESHVAVIRALEYTKKGLEVAIVTPFRKQVNCIREEVKSVYSNEGLENSPIVDTVERLQGQDVDVIIISTSVSSPSYYSQMKSFILEPHRLNVMFSRAKDKVLVVKSDVVEIEKLVLDW